MYLLTGLFFTGCATRGPTHLYMAGDGGSPIVDRDLAGTEHDELDGLLEADAVVVGVGYEYNTDYIWLRLAPGDRLIAVKRSIRDVWYDYALPAEFAAPEGETVALDLAVRSFNRMVYAALPATGVVGKVARYGDPRERFVPGGEPRPIGGLAWDQVSDRLLVLFADHGEVVAFENETDPVHRVTLQAAVDATTLAYDSNRQRYYVPLRGERVLGEFDLDGRLVGRLPWPEGVRAIDAGQRSLVRVF